MINIKNILLLLVSFVISISFVGCKKIASEDAVKQLEEKNYLKFNEYYELLDEEERDKVSERLSNEVNSIVKEFEKSDRKEASYNNTIEKINGLMPEDRKEETNEIVSKIDAIYNEASSGYKIYDEGVILLENKEYEKALDKFKSINIDHPNRNLAKSKINLIEDELEKLKPGPVEIVDFWLARNLIDDQIVHVQFKNMSDRAVKNVFFSVFGYDKNGYPVKVQFNYDDYLNCKLDMTLLPGEISRDDWAWDLYNESAEITQLRVVMNRVEFYEGSSWSNPYYDEEVSKFAGKPLK